jgi:hypothetical protein
MSKYTYALVDGKEKVKGYAFDNKKAAEYMAGYIRGNGQKIKVVRLPYSNSQRAAQRHYNKLRKM